MSQPDVIEGTRRSTRNPRRRQRPENDSLPKDQPRRKRSKISTDTFAAPDEPAIKQNGHAGMNGHGVPPARKGSAPPETLDVVVRGAKKTTTKRAVKSDGSTVLVCYLRSHSDRVGGYANPARHKTTITLCDSSQAHRTFSETVPVVRPRRK